MTITESGPGLQVLQSIFWQHPFLAFEVVLHIILVSFLVSCKMTLVKLSAGTLVMFNTVSSEVYLSVVRLHVSALETLCNVDGWGAMCREIFGCL